MIQIQTHGLKRTRKLQDYALQRTEFALRRFAERLKRVEVDLADENGPRGGVDKRCRITLALHAGGQVRVEAVSGDAMRALDRAAGKLRQALVRRLQKARRFEARRYPARAEAGAAEALGA
ncbi:MAG: HPF/RaiA family ribosome-associated protein [Planctomycetota bacterium]|nr:HPF/RaiA family ribosome-associated protein [Planctomycetota bacterium]